MAGFARKVYKKYADPYIRTRYGGLAADAAKYLLQKEKKSAVISPAKAVNATPLKSYLDRTYQKKCGTEIKQTDFATNPSITTSLATFYSPFTGVAQGITDSTRLGNSIEVKSCQIRATFTCGATSSSATTVRLMVIKQNQMQAAALTGAAVLQDATNIRSARTLDQQRSFTILKDFMFKLSGVNAGDKDAVYHWNWTYRPKTCHSIKWTQADTTGAIGNMLEGNLQIMVMYEQTSGVASGPTSLVYFRTEWVDV